MKKALLLSAIVFFSLFEGCGDSAPNNLGGVITPIDIQVGKPAPDFTLPDSNGNMVHLSDFLGDVVYIDFWAAWCEPCRRLFPSQKALWEEFRDKDFTILGVSYDTSQRMWKDTIRTYGLDWVHTIDDGKSLNGAGQVYRVQGIPQSFLIDKQGIVIAKNVHGDALRDSVQLYVNK